MSNNIDLSKAEIGDRFEDYNGTAMTFVSYQPDRFQHPYVMQPDIGGRRIYREDGMFFECKSCKVNPKSAYSIMRTLTGDAGDGGTECERLERRVAELERKVATYREAARQYKLQRDHLISERDWG